MVDVVLDTAKVGVEEVCLARGVRAYVLSAQPQPYSVLDMNQASRRALTAEHDDAVAGRRWKRCRGYAGAALAHIVCQPRAGPSCPKQADSSPPVGTLVTLEPCQRGILTVA